MATAKTKNTIVKHLANNLPNAIKNAMKGLTSIEPIYEFILHYRGNINIARLLDPKLLD